MPLGWFNCLGCGERGGWNKLAKKTGLPKIKEWDNKEKSVGDILTKEDEGTLLGDDGMSLRTVFKVMNCPEAQPWPVMIDWRGFKGDLIRAVGGLIINDYHNDDVAVLFPIKIGGKTRGAVKAIYEKRTKQQLGYVTMKGEWVNNYGLFPYEYTKALIKQNGYDFVVLVEGPRDALRLLKLGIPALAALGANTFGKTKALYVQSIGADFVYAMPDNDSGGAALWRNIKGKLKGKIPLKRLKLPREKNEKGELIKMDPFNAPAEIMRNLKVLLKEKHGWRKSGIPQFKPALLKGSK